MELTPVQFPGPPGFGGGAVTLKLSVEAYARTCAPIARPMVSPAAKSVFASPGQGVCACWVASRASRKAASSGKNDFNTTSDAPAAAAAGDGCSDPDFESSAATTALY